MHDARGLGWPLFAHLDAGDAASLASGLPEVRVPAGAAIVEQGDPRPGLYVIASGEATVTVCTPGGERVVATLGPGSVVGEMSLLAGEPASATVRAVGDVEARWFERDAFWDAAQAHPQLLRNLSAIVARRLGRTTRRSAGERERRWTTLLDHGAPPLAALALAASVAWHTRERVLLLTLDAGLAQAALASLGGRAPAPVRGADGATLVRAGARRGGGVDLLVPARPPTTRREAVALADALPDGHRHVLVHAGASTAPDAEEGAIAAELRPLPGSGVRIVAPDAAGGPRSVPPLTLEDLDALAAGTLAPDGPAGRALGRTARAIAGLRVGLALGAGSMKGYAHFGVMRVMEREGIPVDCVAGSSIGAQVAFLRALELPVDDAMDVVDELSRRTVRYALSTSGLLSSAGLRRGLQWYCGERRIEDVPVPLGVVTTDLATGSEVVFRRGLVWPALLASLSIPGVYPAQRIAGRLLTDGGVANPVPSSVTRGMGADVVVAVRLGGARGGAPATAVGAPPAGAVPSMVTTVLRSLEIMQRRIAVGGADAASVVVEPWFDPREATGIRRFPQGRRYHDNGVAAAEAALPRLRALLPWLSAA